MNKQLYIYILAIMICCLMSFCSANTKNKPTTRNLNLSKNEVQKNNVKKEDSIKNKNNKVNIFKAGAAKVDITLPYDSNASEFSKVKTSKRIHDKLYVKSLILDDGKNKIALIVADNQGIPAWVIDRAKTSINQKVGIPISNIMISSTHTHSGIISSNAPINLNPNGKINEYEALIVKKIVESSELALKNLEPALIGWDRFDKPEYVYNRRWYMKTPQKNPFGTNDSVKTNPGFLHPENLLKPAGPTDPQIYFIAIKSTDGHPIAIFANYSLHYVGAKEGDISADYYGELENSLSKKLNANSQKPKFIGIMSNGTSADINNIDYSSKKPTIDPYVKIKMVSDDIAKNIVEKYKNLNFNNWVSLESSTRSINLNLRRPIGKIKENISMAQKSKVNDKTISNDQRSYAVRVNNFEKLYPKNAAITLQVIKIGDLAINAIPLEVFAETGLNLKLNSSFKYSFNIGLANGHWGYMPTPQQFKKGGYESWLTVSRFQEDASEIISSNLFQMQKELKKY